MKQNQYEKALEMIRASNFSVKKLKYARGHDGDAMQADVYANGTKIAEIWDDSYGAALSVHYMKTDKVALLTEFLDSLPSFRNADRGWDFALEDEKRIDAEEFFWQLVTNAGVMKQFRAGMRKTMAILDGEVITWKWKAKDIDLPMRFRDGSTRTPRQVVEAAGARLLTGMPEEEAFKLWEANISEEVQ